MDKVVKQLIQHGADPWIADSGQVSPLHLMADRGYDKLIRLAFKKWPNKSAQVVDSSGYTPLMWIGQSAFLDAEKQHGLQAMGQGFSAIFNALDGKEIKPTEKAKPPVAYITEGHLKSAQILTQQGSDINTKTKGGWTALHLATRMGAVNLAQVLIKKGADTQIKLSSGHTPLDAARGLGQTEMEALLNEANKRR